MARNIGIGHQNFEYMIQNNFFYIDKTNFIKEWWENGDLVTLITRPRRFGKTLTISMTEQFFSVQYAGRQDLFENLSIWKDEQYHRLQGTYPVISLSFANVKQKDYLQTKQRICQLITELYNKNYFLLDSGLLTEDDKKYFLSVCMDMPEVIATLSIYKLSDFLSRYYKKKVIILLDEYDTPMQQAYVGGYWDEIVEFTKNMFNSAFKTNPWLERAILTGITRVSKESVFSDLNNLRVITTTTKSYMDSFGFTQKEVDTALEEYQLTEEKEKVKQWYDGFTFGSISGIYNPWSIINFLKEKSFACYWANTSSNDLVSKLIQEGEAGIKIIMEDLLENRGLHIMMDEQIIYSQLSHKTSAVWSLLLASGYLKVESFAINERRGKPEYDLRLTNKEVRLMFEQMIEDWFIEYTPAYNKFIKALLSEDENAMNIYMNKVTLATFSYFDTGGKSSKDTEPEKFYHGFVLGLMVELSGRYIITSNRESGFGRYDVMLEPCNQKDNAFILEFKVYNPEKEKNLQDTVKLALQQIEDKKYAAVLETKGIFAERIRKYGFAFQGKNVLIGSA